MEDIDEPAYTFKDTVSCTTPLIAEKPNGDSHAGRGCFYWHADDPLIIGLHFEVMMTSLVVTPEMVPLPASLGMTPTCMRCDEVVDYGSIGALVPSEADPEIGELLCLMCADEDTHTEYEESIWALGLAELEGALHSEPPCPDVGAAKVRVWRLDEDNFQIALRNGAHLLFLVVPLDRLRLTIEAIVAYERDHGDGVEDYLESGLASLERLANTGEG